MDSQEMNRYLESRIEALRIEAKRFNVTIHPEETDKGRAQVEKVARAIHAAARPDLPERDEHYQRWADGYRAMASAALEALKEA